MIFISNVTFDFYGKWCADLKKMWSHWSYSSHFPHIFLNSVYVCSRVQCHGIACACNSVQCHRLACAWNSMCSVWCVPCCAWCGCCLVWIHAVNHGDSDVGFNTRRVSRDLGLWGQLLGFRYRSMLLLNLKIYIFSLVLFSPPPFFVLVIIWNLYLYVYSTILT